MADMRWFLACLLVSAGVTYLVRAVPLVLIKKKITNRFLRSFRCRIGKSHLIRTPCIRAILIS